MPFPKPLAEDEKESPEEAALMHIHRTILNRMGERLAARMPKHEKKPDLPISGDAPPKSPAASHVDKLKAHLARGK